MRLLLVPFLALFLLTGTKAPADPLHPEIWFTPNNPVDWLNMWTDDAPWQEAAKKVDVIVLQYNDIRKLPAAQLLQIAGFAQRHNMRIELGAEVIAKVAGAGCGNIEGYAFHGEVMQAVTILQNLGIPVYSLDMDEPLWFGHYQTAALGGCRLSIPDLVTSTALIMQDIVAVYPRIKLIELEPIPAVTSQPGWRDDWTQFRLGLAKAIGVPITFVHADIGWGDPTWQASLVTFNQYLREQNLGLGIFFNAATNTTDADWVNAAAGYMDTIEGQLGIIPAHADFSTWTPFPSHNMPETSPSTMTWLINRLVRPLSSLQAHFAGSSAVGKLTTKTGKPIANATVRGFLPGVDLTKPLPVTVATGIVPPNVIGALLVIRINMECGAGCNGLNDLLIGPLQYAETLGGSGHGTLVPPLTPGTQNGSHFDGQLIGGSTVTRLIAAPGQSFHQNSNQFAATAGAKFQLTIPAGTVGGNGWTGYIGLVWVTAAGLDAIPRFMFTPPVGKALMSTAVTAADGTFQLLHMPRQTYQRNPITLEFDGQSGTFRGSVWTPFN